MNATKEEDAQVGRDELNLCEFPIALISDRAPEGMKTVKYKDSIFDQSSKATVQRVVTLTGSDEFGLPCASDADVLIALLHHTRTTNNFSARRVPFTRYELMKILRWDDESHYYNRVRTSLRRWAGVTVYYDLSWRQRTAKKWTTKMVHILDSVELHSDPGRRKVGQEPASWYSWGEVIFESLQDGNLKRLDLDLYFGLKSAISKFMYRYLDKHFHNREVLSLDLDTFGYEKIGISRSCNTAQVKRRLQPAIEELESIGFIEKSHDRYERIDQGCWKIVFLRKNIPEVTPEPPPVLSPTILRLMEYGICETSARRLAADHGQENIDRQIRVMLWKQKNSKLIKEPDGYLVRAIEGNWPVPKEMMEHPKKAEMKQARVIEEQDKTTQRQINRINDKKIQEYWDKLPEDERSIFMIEALAATTVEIRTHIQSIKAGDPLYRGHMAALRDEHIRRKLGLPPVS